MLRSDRTHIDRVTIHNYYVRVEIEIVLKVLAVQLQVRHGVTPRDIETENNDDLFPRFQRLVGYHVLVTRFCDCAARAIISNGC